ncbi:hypothetical protein NQZ68_016941 [Dissostichus eleginoides]|nr:hypothetical protein NQZ68_016941 [Dissostichus eleginoides]
MYIVCSSAGSHVQVENDRLNGGHHAETSGKDPFPGQETGRVPGSDSPNTSDTESNEEVVSRARVSARESEQLSDAQPHAIAQRQGFREKAMAKMIGCSTSYLYRKLRYLGIAMRDRFTPINDNDLEQHIRRLHDRFPKAGCENRPSSSSPEVEQCCRKTHYVPFPNSLWHIDGHMRLIR